MWSASCQPDSCARLLSQDYLFSQEGNTRSFNVGAASRVWHGRIAGAYRHWTVSLDHLHLEYHLNSPWLHLQCNPNFARIQFCGSIFGPCKATGQPISYGIAHEPCCWGSQFAILPVHSWSHYTCVQRSICFLGFKNYWNTGIPSNPSSYSHIWAIWSRYFHGHHGHLRSKSLRPVAQVAGSGSVVTDLVVPYNGHQLKGSELEGQCEPWYAQNLYNIYHIYIYTIYIYILYQWMWQLSMG